jgi:hypothetical protein
MSIKTFRGFHGAAITVSTHFLHVAVHSALQACSSASCTCGSFTRSLSTWSRNPPSLALISSSVAISAYAFSSLRC